METLQLIILIAGIGLGFFIQTVAGFAGGLFALPIILQVIPMQEAVAYLSVFLCLFSILLVYRNWSEIDKKTVQELSVGIIVGLAAGVGILKMGSPILLKRLLGVFILLFVGYHFFRKKKIRLPGRWGILFGLAGGVFSGMFSAGGPTYVMYVYNRIDGAAVFRATLIGILSITNILRLPMLVVSDILTTDILMTSLYIVPAFLLALFLGNKLYKRINEHAFKNILMILLVVSGISLLIR
jgi:uncharacterized membrane protein YfcA